MHTIHVDSITHRILLYLEDHPGAVRRDIYTAVANDETPRSSVSNMMQSLKNSGAIENRGGISHSARWYLADSPEVSDRYRDISENLLNELTAVHHTRREEYLAKRLQEIFG